jgi:hypothetical protein
MGTYNLGRFSGKDGKDIHLLLYSLSRKSYSTSQIFLTNELKCSYSIILRAPSIQIRQAA